MATAALHTEDQIRRMTPISTPKSQQASVMALSKRLGEVPHTDKRKIAACIVMELLARGDAVTVVPVGKELTTQQAADILNISRQFLIRLLDEGKLLHSKTGKHRRLKIEDVLAFKAKRSKERKAGLRKLSEMTQEIGGYDPEDT